jgi:hypothetical protein
MPIGAGLVRDVRLFFVEFLQHLRIAMGTMVVFDCIGFLANGLVTAINDVIGHPDVVTESAQFFRLKPQTTTIGATIDLDLVVVNRFHLA